MTRKVYKSAMGKSVDLGALLLQNEQVRAVGNMGVNAAGDVVDSNNKVVDQRNRQVQRQYRRQTNVGSSPIATSNLTARKQQDMTNSEATVESVNESQPVNEELKIDLDNQQIDNKEQSQSQKSGGLAAAIARNREIKQELEKTLRQRQLEQGLKKI
jgi:hypothetical protein